MFHLLTLVYVLTNKNLPRAIHLLLYLFMLVIKIHMFIDYATSQCINSF